MLRRLWNRCRLRVYRPSPAVSRGSELHGFLDQRWLTPRWEKVSVEYLTATVEGTLEVERERLRALLPVAERGDLFMIDIPARSPTEKTTGPALVAYYDERGTLLDEFPYVWCGF